MELEIVHPDALKRLMRSINGKAVEVSSLELARKKLNWPDLSRKPPEEHIRKAAEDLASLLLNPPEEFDVRELPGRYYTIQIGRVKA
jgi:hypothetical protein